jgi:hypothetical protein
MLIVSKAMPFFVILFLGLQDLRRHAFLGRLFSKNSFDESVLFLQKISRIKYSSSSSVSVIEFIPHNQWYFIPF